MNIRPIKTIEDYENIMQRIDRLMDAAENTAEADELDILTLLIERYEAQAYPIEAPSAVDMIKFRMDQLGLEPKDLVNIIGSRSKVSEILNQKRKLSLNMIRNLHRHLAIPLEPLVMRQ
jgi:HTH-type transcriptional regulator/antitoxin HigA